MIVVNKDMDILAQYDKKKLVPFGEFLPMEKVLKSIGLKTIASGYSSFSKGQGKSVLKIEFDKYRDLSNNEWNKHKKYNSALIYTSIASGSLWLINGIHAYIVGPRPKKDIIQKWNVAIPKQK